MPQGFLRDKIAVVTGASSGIGRATALELAKAGAHLVIASRRKMLLEELASEIEELGREALLEVVDITEREQVERLISKVISHYGQIDILIVCAGVYYRSLVENLSLDIVDRSLAINFYGGLFTILAVLPHMRARNTGHIVLVSTMDTKLGLPGDGPYAIAKSALSSFVDVLRQELHETGVHTTIILPGRVDTAFIEDLKLPRGSMIISPQVVARTIVRSIKRRKAIVILPFLANVLYIIKVFSPRLADWIIRLLHMQGWEKEEVRSNSSGNSLVKEQIGD